VPAVRDVPLPEALPEPLPEKIEIETVAVEVVNKSAEINNIKEALHTVISGENLYSISMKYMSNLMHYVSGIISQRKTKSA